VGGVSFDEKDVNNLRRISGIDYVVPIFTKSVSVEAGGDVSRSTSKKIGSIMAISEDGFKLMNVEIEFGKLFEKSDVQGGAKLAFLGYTIATDIFGDLERQ
jgi:hypothetical protein